MNRTDERSLLLAQLLVWEGALKRSRVMELYGLSPVRASQWMRDFREAFPGWTEWDSIGRRYVAADKAFREWGARSEGARPADQGFAQYLAQVALTGSYFSEDSTNPLSAFPDFSTPSPAIFSRLRRAIEECKAVELTYRSFANPEPHQRVVEPHALVRAGRRWHVRAYCIANEDFRDYSLGRIARAVLLTGQSAKHGPTDDVAWSTPVEVVLTAHPALSRQQEEVVRFEYFKGTSARRQSCRAALVAYLIQDLRAATDPVAQKPPDFQLSVANIDALRAWLFPSAQPAPI
jgi:hypothetical protein